MANTYGVKELFINIIRYVEDQFTNERNKDDRRLANLIGYRKNDRQYLNQRLYNIVRNLKNKMEVKVTFVKDNSMGNIPKYGVSTKKVKITYQENKKTVKGYKAIGVVGFYTSNAHINVTNVFINNAKSASSQATLNITATNLTNDTINNVKVSAAVLWVRTDLEYAIDRVSLKTGYENQ